MANKNTNLGGTDWTGTDEIKAEDLNDTFDAAFLKVFNAPPWFTDSDYYTVYDDFETEVSASLWDADAGATWSNTSNAGGVAGEAYLVSSRINIVGTVTTTLTSNSMVANRHIWARVVLRDNTGDSDSGTTTFKFGIGNATDGFTDYTVCSANGSDLGWKCYVPTELLVVAKTGNTYDIYAGGTQLASDVSLPNGCEIRFTTIAYSPGGTYSSEALMYVDDVRYSKYDVV